MINTNDLSYKPLQSSFLFSLHLRLIISLEISIKLFDISLPQLFQILHAILQNRYKKIYGLVKSYSDSQPSRCLILDMHSNPESSLLIIPLMLGRVQEGYCPEHPCSLFGACFAPSSIVIWSHVDIPTIGNICGYISIWSVDTFTR